MGLPGEKGYGTTSIASPSGLLPTSGHHQPEALRAAKVNRRLSALYNKIMRA
jgi:hypothetical protein